MSDSPLLIRLSTTQQPQNGPPVRYDDARDELMVISLGVEVAAVDVAAGSPMTKKHDIEKGEDAKDRW